MYLTDVIYNSLQSLGKENNYPGQDRQSRGEMIVPCVDSSGYHLLAMNFDGIAN